MLTPLLKVKRLNELAATGQLKGKRVFIRADLNVPQDEAGNITEDTRIRASIPAIQMCLDSGAAVMVTSHLGRPSEGAFKPEDSLAPIAHRIADLLNRKVPLISNWVDGGFDLAVGDVVILENCRVNVGEKKNTDELAKKMAALCDVYVNDAFGTAHRAEATTYGIARYAKVACAGPLMAAELDALSRALAEPKRPLVAIVAGSKVSTKLTILKSLAEKVDELIVGGGIANTFLLAKGLSIGKSLAEPDLVDEAKEIIATLHKQGIHTILLIGDRKIKCEQVGKALCIQEIISEQSPSDKLNKLEALTKISPTAMVGDGINDAPALAKATIGISLSNASHIAIQSAQVILMNQGLKNLPMALGLGRRTYETIKENLAWAFSYNIIAIPVAALGLLGTWGPTYGALIMGLSDVVLAINSLRLFKKKLV